MVSRGMAPPAVGSEGRVLEIDLADESSGESTIWSDSRRMDLGWSSPSLTDALEERTQRTYRYGIGLVCIGATLNWLGFAQGHGYVDPLRYLGVACVISGSFCVCMAMCRWFGKPFSFSYSRRRSRQREELAECRRNGDVHVINVSVPIHTFPAHCPEKPPDYESISPGQPPSYDQAIKLSPYSLAKEIQDGPPIHLIMSDSHSQEILHSQSSSHQEIGLNTISEENPGTADSHSPNQSPPPHYNQCVETIVTIEEKQRQSENELKSDNLANANISEILMTCAHG